jgi:aquaporin Z
MKTWQKYAAEFFGTFILVGGGTGAIIGAGVGGGDITAIALGFGFALMVALFAVGRISGGHFNPAVSLAAFLDRRIGLIDLGAYWVAQVAGGITASALLAWVYSREYVGFTYSSLNRGAGINELAGFIVEAVFTLVFVFVVLVLLKSDRPGKYFGIGAAYALIQLVGLVMTNASVNPVRSLAPAVIGGTWDGFWVFIAGPALGAIVGWALYKIIVEGDVSLGDNVAAIRDEVEETAETIGERIEEGFEQIEDRFDKD